MARAFAKAFYKSKAWRQCRASYIAQRRSIDGGLCETCQDRLGYIVHHIIWLTEENIHNPDISLNHAHLRYDCLICHNREGEGEQAAARCYFDADGQPAPVIPDPPCRLW